MYYYTLAAYPLDTPLYIHVGGSGLNRMELRLHLYPVEFVWALIVSYLSRLPGRDTRADLCRIRSTMAPLDDG